MAQANAKKKEGAWETVKTIFWALIIAMAFRSILYQPFSIPSGSMKPTLLVGDYLFVSKFSYGYSRYSFPFAPNIVDGRIWGSMPERGDVVVFKRPGADRCSEGPIEFGARIGSALLSTFGVMRPIRDPNDCIDYIKRVVGLPGDHVQMINGVLHINDEPVSMERTEDFVEIKGLDGEAQSLQGCRNEPVPQGGLCAHETWTEIFAGDGGHRVLNMGTTQQDNTQVFTVEPDHIFFMGDNRDNSIDSRFSQVGQVPVENLIGRAELIALSSEGAFWEIWKWRFGRFFELIR